MSLERNTVILGALLHDIGKYLQRGEFGEVKVSGQHPQVGADFVSAWRDELGRCVDIDLLKTLVQRHHESPAFPAELQVGTLTDPHVRALARLVSRADNLSSSERAPREEARGRQPFRTTSLAPIFDRIEITQERMPQPHHFLHRPLTDTGTEPPIFSVEGREAAQTEVTGHIRAFGQQFAQLRDELKWEDFNCVLTHILSLLQTYTWCIPSDTQTELPDVSLYDHLRVTAALAACLYDYHGGRGTLDDEAVKTKNQTRCVLLIGDLSGIQDYIFDISTVGAGGVAKRLRARSFFVQLLGEAASLRVLQTMDLPVTNVLMASGGKFYAVLPNVSNVASLLEGLQTEFDESMLREYHGLLAINLAWTEVSDQDFAAGQFGDTLSRLHARLQRRKLNRLANALQKNGLWQAEFVREIFSGETVCLSCHRFPASRNQEKPDKPGQDICVQCASQLKLGRYLTTARYVSFFNDGKGEIPCLGISASVDRVAHPEAILVLSLNNPDLSEVAQSPATFRYLANHIPRDSEGAPVTFDQIAGNGLLGILKADVDYLGQIFQEGLRRDPPAVSLDTVSRIASLSRQMDWFFSGWLEWLLNSKYPDCYTVYSGGDDLLLVGPRKRVLDLAMNVREGLERYTRHPEVTLSAGIAVVPHRLPLAHTIGQADRALEVAKEGGRNRICLLQDVLLWDALPDVRQEVDFLGQADPGSAYLYHLLHCAGLWQRYRREGILAGLRYHPMLAYQLGRNINKEKQPGLYNWTLRLLECPPSTEVQRILDHLHLVVQWVLLNKREN